MRGEREAQLPDGAEDVLLGRVVPDADRLRNLGNRSPSSGLIPSIAAATSLRQSALAARRSGSGVFDAAVSTTSDNGVGA
jgi:hypothetical protein